MKIGKRISVGYNRTGQKFFDYIARFKETIHSYYFNPSCTFSQSFPWTGELERMRGLNTYGIEGNILFNILPFQKSTADNARVLEEFLKLPNLNINAVTVLTQESIDFFKKIDSSLKFHISVHVPIESTKDLRTHFRIEDVHCINLSQKQVFNLDLISEIHDLGIKVKLLANEMCAWDRNNWYNYFFGENVCRTTGFCGRGCRQKFRGEHAWLNLTRQGFTKEFLPYYGDKLDIIKISSRCMPLNYLKLICEDFLQNDKSSFFDQCIFADGIPAAFIEKRFQCDHRCKECLFCREIYDRYVVNHRWGRLLKARNLGYIVRRYVMVKLKV